MAELVWKDEFNAKAAVYVRADEITKWYSSGSLENVSWSSDEVKSLFVTGAVVTPQPKPTDEAILSSGSTTPTGAIVWGVVGPVVFLICAAVVLVWILRRRKSQQRHEASQGKYAKPELETIPGVRHARPRWRDAPG